VISFRIPTKELAYFGRNCLLITESVEVSFCLDLFCNFFGSSQKSCKNRKYNLIKMIDFNKYIVVVAKKAFCKKLNRFEHHQKMWEMFLFSVQAC
jgi:hypothetical protein